MKTIIIDDEDANIEVLTCQLTKYCSHLQLVGSARSAEEGYSLIRETKPDLVFLDVCMPEGTGFDLLRMFDTIDFEVIFVTGHDDYALQAFDFSALDYLLKPVDSDRLIRAVAKAERSLELHETGRLMQFLVSLDEDTGQLKKITLHRNEKVVLLPVDEICCVEASGNYSQVVTTNNERFLCARTLLAYEQLLKAYPSFVRINKKCIININFVDSYTKGTDCYVTLTNGSELEVSRRKKTEILQQLKKYNWI